MSGDKKPLDALRRSRLAHFCKDLQEANTQTCKSDADESIVGENCRSMLHEDSSRSVVHNYTINIDISSMEDLHTLQNLLPKIKGFDHKKDGCFDAAVIPEFSVPPHVDKEKLDLDDDDELPDYSYILNLPRKKSSGRHTRRVKKCGSDLPSIADLYASRRSSSTAGEKWLSTTSSSAMAHTTMIRSDSEDEVPEDVVGFKESRKRPFTSTGLNATADAGVSMKKLQRCTHCSDRETNESLSCGHFFCTVCLATLLVDANGADAMCPYPKCLTVFEKWMTF